MAENATVLQALVEMMEEKGVAREELAQRTYDGFFRGWTVRSDEDES